MSSKLEFMVPSQETLDLVPVYSSVISILNRISNGHDKLIISRAAFAKTLLEEKCPLEEGLVNLCLAYEDFKKKEEDGR